MFGTNPYAQAGWYNPANPHSVNDHKGPSIASQPPTFGALPYPTQDLIIPIRKFIFTSQRQGLVTGCDVMDSVSRSRAYKIRMAQNGHEYTSVTRGNGTSVGFIVWKTQGAEVEIYGVVGRQKTSHWLPLAPDHSSRLMQLSGRHYTWQFARDAMYLYTYSLNRLHQLGKVYPASDGTTILEASEQVIADGLLDSVITAIIAILSERISD